MNSSTRQVYIANTNILMFPIWNNVPQQRIEIVTIILEFILRKLFDTDSIFLKT